MNQIKCLACWQVKEFRDLNRDYFCRDCRNKYDQFFFNTVPRCDACHKFIEKQLIKGSSIWDTYPQPVPKVRIGVMVNGLAKDFIQSKNGKQKLEGWFYFCESCSSELDNGIKKEDEPKLIAFNQEKGRLASLIEVSESRLGENLV